MKAPAERGLSLAAIALFAALVWLPGDFRRDLWEPDEARYAYVAREMRAGGHWAVPHRSGEYYAHKPPLMFWLQNGFAALAGGTVNRVTARLPSLLGAILSLWAASRLAGRWAGAGTGRRVVPILSTAYLFWQYSGWGHIDALLCGLQMAALHLLVAADERARPLLPRIAAHLLLGLAVLAKGPVGYAVPLGAYTVATLAAGTRGPASRWGHLALALPAAALPVALWLGTIYLCDLAPPGYLAELLFTQNVGRVTGGAAMLAGHERPWYYFALHFPLEFMPWTLFLPAAWQALGADADGQRLRRRLAGWGLFVLAFFSLPASKRNLYAMLAYPAGAILIAAAWDRLAAQAGRAARAGALAMGALFVLLGIGCLGAGLHPRLPFAAPVLWPGGVALGAGGAWLLRHAGTGRLEAPWFAVCCATLLAALVSVSTLVLPAINPLKTPTALVAAAAQHLPPGTPLLIYDMNGEIMPLYCRAQGKRVASLDELCGAMREQRKGMAVFERQKWEPLRDAIPYATQTGMFTMGGEDFVWIAFDVGAESQAITTAPISARSPGITGIWRRATAECSQSARALGKLGYGLERTR